MESQSGRQPPSALSANARGMIFFIASLAPTKIFAHFALLGGGIGKAAIAEAFVPALLVLVVGRHLGPFFKSVHHLEIVIPFSGEASIAAVLPAQLIFRRPFRLHGGK